MTDSLTHLFEDPTFQLTDTTSEDEIRLTVISFSTGLEKVYTFKSPGEDKYNNSIVALFISDIFDMKFGSLVAIELKGDINAYKEAEKLIEEVAVVMNRKCTITRFNDQSECYLVSGGAMLGITYKQANNLCDDKIKHFNTMKDNMFKYEAEKIKTRGEEKLKVANDVFNSLFNEN